MQYISQRNKGCRMKEYSFNGYTYITMENNLLTVNILADKGTDILNINYKPMDMDFMWQNPYRGMGTYHKDVSTTGSENGNFLDHYPGGWHEAFPGGGPYEDKGIQLGLHGEVSLLQWGFHICEDTEEKISVVFYTQTKRTPYSVKKTITLEKDSTEIAFHERIENLSNQPMQYMWGHHPAIGAPFLDADCRIDIPAEFFLVDEKFSDETSFFEKGKRYPWPVCMGKDEKTHDMSLTAEAPSAELLYFPELKDGNCTITNTKTKLGMKFSWDKNIFDTIWYWRMLGGLHDYPWYGRAYCIGLEFWRGYPDFEGAKKNGSIKTIEANQTIETTYKCCVFTIE